MQAADKIIVLQEGGLTQFGPRSAESQHDRAWREGCGCYDDLEGERMTRA